MNYGIFKFKAEFLWEMSCQELNALVKSNSEQNVANLGNAYKRKRFFETL